MADYSLMPIEIEPGLVSLDSPYAARGRYIVDPSAFVGNVRFFQGRAEKSGGFRPLTTTALDSAARDVHAWAALDGTTYLAWGTVSKLWLYTGNTLYDITPIGFAPLIGGATQTGFGELGFGSNFFGGSSTTIRAGVKTLIWTLGNWGEDLVACSWGGSLYRWSKAGGTGTPAAIVAGAPSPTQSTCSGAGRPWRSVGPHGGPAVRDEGMISTLA